jgi:DNA-binding phage protein
MEIRVVEKARIVDAYKRGVGIALLATRFRMTRARVRHILSEDAEAAELLIDRRKPYKCISSKQKANIIFKKIHMKEGATKIARDEGVGRQAVYDVLAENSDIIELMRHNERQIAMALSNKLLENTENYADGLDRMLKECADKKKLKNSTITQIANGIEQYRKLFLSRAIDEDGCDASTAAHSQLVAIMKEALLEVEAADISATGEFEPKPTQNPPVHEDERQIFDL